MCKIFMYLLLDNKSEQSHTRCALFFRKYLCVKIGRFKYVFKSTMASKILPVVNITKPPFYVYSRSICIDINTKYSSKTQKDQIGSLGKRTPY